MHSGTPEKRPKKEPVCEHITFNKTSAFNVYSTMLNSAFEDLVPRPVLGLCPRTPTTNGTSFKHAFWSPNKSLDYTLLHERRLAVSLSSPLQTTWTLSLLSTSKLMLFCRTKRLDTVSTDRPTRSYIHVQLCQHSLTTLYYPRRRSQEFLPEGALRALEA